MKNCFEFSLPGLASFIQMIGVFEILDILNRFQVITGVVTLDVHCIRTEELSRMRHVARRCSEGYNLMAPSSVIKYLTELITNPATPEAAYTINTALKTADLKKHGHHQNFYQLLAESMVRRLIFTKLSQIYCPLIEEIRFNQDLLNVLLNQNLIYIEHLNELSEDAQKVSHRIIHNINSYQKLRKFSSICNKWCRDINLKELVYELALDIECFQMIKLDDQINDDMKNNACLIY